VYISNLAEASKYGAWLGEWGLKTLLQLVSSLPSSFA